MAVKKTTEPAKPAAAEAVVLTASGQHIRTYTREIHGDAFEDLAREKAAQHEGAQVEVR